MTPQRVLMVFTIMNRGGAETMVMNYYRHIDRRRLQFDFLVHRETPGIYEEEIRELGGRIYRLPPITLSGLAAYRREVARFFDEHPEYRLVHGHCSELGYWVYREAAARNIPFIAAHAHSSPLGMDKNSLFRFLLKHLMRPYLTHRFTCNELCGRWLFGRKGMKDAVVVRNAIDAGKFSYSPETRERVRREMGWEGKLVAGHTGNFSWPKNHEFLLRVFQAFLGLHPDSLLVLAGSGGEKEEQVRQEAERAEWRGRIRLLGGRDDIPDLLQGMDVFVFPSWFEGFGIAMLEAQAAGLPVLASDRVPEDAAVVPGHVSFLSLRESPEVWARKMEELARGWRRNDTAAAIRQAGLDIASNAQKLQEFYLEQGGES